MNRFLARTGRILLPTLIASLLSTAVVADGHKHKPDFAQLADELSLSESQKAGFIDTMEEQHQKRRELRHTNRQEKRKMLAQHRSETLDVISNILDDEQLARFKAIMKERRQEMKKKRDDNQ